MARLDRDTRLRYQAAIQYSVGKILETSANEATHDPSGNPLSPRSFSREVMSAAGLLVFQKVPILAADLEAFAKHAKRQKVITDDVLLCARRNPDLEIRHPAYLLPFDHLTASAVDSVESAAKLENTAKSLKADKQETLKKSLTTSTTAKRPPEDGQREKPRTDVEVIDLDDME